LTIKTPDFTAPPAKETQQKSGYHTLLCGR